MWAQTGPSKTRGDSGPRTRKAVLAAFGPRLERLDPERAAKDAKTELQEMLQAAHRALPV